MSPTARTFRTVAVVLGIILVAVIGMPLASWAAQHMFALAPGDTITVQCDTRLAGRVRGKESTIECMQPTVVAATATVVPTAPPVPTNPPAPTAVPTQVPGSEQPVAGQKCPDWVHDQYMVTGPDGGLYRTWHAPIDPQYKCWFGHEHGADPRTSKADNTLPAFGYAGKMAGLNEPHEAFKVFVLHAGQASDNGLVMNGDYRIIFHMGTSRVGRYTNQFHSMEYDYVARDGSGRHAHVYGMADTGTNRGSTCQNPRQNGRDFSTIGCNDPYEIWTFNFSIIHPDDPYRGALEVRTYLSGAVAAFDPITTRDPADETKLVFTQDYRRPGSGVDPQGPNAEFLGCKRESYGGPNYWQNKGRPTTYYTNPYGLVQPGPGPGLIKQEVSATASTTFEQFKYPQSFCGNNIRFPN
jgi:hypothetical protein